MKIACPEETALEMGWSDGDTVAQRAKLLGKTDYAAYLRRRLKELAS